MSGLSLQEPVPLGLFTNSSNRPSVAVEGARKSVHRLGPAGSWIGLRRSQKEILVVVAP